MILREHGTAAETRVAAVKIPACEEDGNAHQGKDEQTDGRGLTELWSYRPALAPLGEQGDVMRREVQSVHCLLYTSDAADE